MSKQPKILIIDDEKLIRWSFEKKLGGVGYLVILAENGQEGLDLFERRMPDVVFLDNHLPDVKGLDLISKLKAINEEAIIVFMTAYESVDVAVEAMKNGASEYIRKPFTFNEILVILDHIHEKINLNNEILLLRRQNKEDITFDNIIHKSEVIQELVRDSKKISLTEATTILLLGESGTGKDLFARAIHNESNRKMKPFVTINCSSLPDTLLESELFGHEKGAFTDATSMKKGLFEIADGGTVFLDEIGELSLSTQVKLLRVLENRIFIRLGSTKEIELDVRIIAATNKNLKSAMEDKSFREDLYYRLQVFQIEIPPLSQRKEDLPLLIEYFISLFNKMFGKEIAAIDPEALILMEQYNWPGNVRELRNVIERAIILQSGNTLDVSILPYEINTAKASGSGGPTYLFELPEEGISLNELEKQLIRQALEKTAYNQTKASGLLGISRDKFRYKQKKHNL